MKLPHLSPVAIALTLAFCAPLQAAQVVPAANLLNGQTLSSLDGTMDDRSAEPMSFKALHQFYSAHQCQKMHSIFINHLDY